MWLLGHLGIGYQIAKPVTNRLPKVFVLLGTLLPDLIDKPLYYALVFFTGKTSRELGLISCTRTIAHTAIFLFFLLVIAWLKKSKIFAALSVGVATHLLLDSVQDYYFNHFIEDLSLSKGDPSSSLMALVFPYFGQFAEMPFDSIQDHLKSGSRSFTLLGEVIGFILLGYHYWKFKVWRNRPLWKKPKVGQ